MGKRAVYEKCPVEDFLDIVSGKWRTIIVTKLLNEGTQRFGELKKILPQISTRTLTTSLRDLEHHGILTRKIYPEIPPRVEYKLTKKGKSLKPILDSMANWYIDWYSSQK